MTETIENKTFDEIRVGDAASLTKSLRAEEVETWAAVTGNPNFLADGGMQGAAGALDDGAGGGGMWAVACRARARAPGR